MTAAPLGEREVLEARATAGIERNGALRGLDRLVVAREANQASAYVVNGSPVVGREARRLLEGAQGLLASVEALGLDPEVIVREGVLGLGRHVRGEEGHAVVPCA